MERKQTASDNLLCFSLTDSEAAAEFLLPLLTGLGGFLRNGINTEEKQN